MKFLEGRIKVFLIFSSCFIGQWSLASVRASGAEDRVVVDQAVERALEYLQRTQQTTGAWVGENNQRSPAISALAVMAFLSAGHVPGEGKYGETVSKGVDWVLQQQHANGLIAPGGHQEMYHHGICTLMLAEVVGMTEGKQADEIRRKLVKAIEIILRAQRTTGQHKGGWRYTVAGNDGDISVTGWQIMALRAAKNLGCDVPAERIQMAVEYIKRCQDPSTGGFRYHPGAHLTIPCTGTSILALEICGKEYHRAPELLKAGSFLLRNPPQWGQAYFPYAIYYCSQATFQLGGQYWESYRTKLHESLFRNQSPNGAWQEGHLGPIYPTAMAVLALTVEYRYLPIYQRAEEPADVAGKSDSK
jgi:prenyltransferase/squalene oxidase-like repeat protein